MRGFAVERERFELAMRGDEQSSAGSFIRAAGFDADQAIFDDVHAADAIGCSDFIELIEQRDRREILAVDGNRSAAYESDFHGGGLARARSRAK